MSDRSRISSPPTSTGSPSATSSVASPSGPTPSDLPAGLMTLRSGQVRLLASLGQPQDKKQDSTTNATSGLPGSVSSASVDLQSFLVSRFRARTASRGSTLFRLTWKERATPLLRSIPALRASALRTSGSDSTSSRSGTTSPEPEGPCAPWPTPVKQDAHSSARHGYMLKGNPGTTLLDAARMTQTPGGQWIRCTDGRSRPVEPGTQPMVDGITTGRVGRLRAYGNAIVAPLAATFIASVIDVLVGDH